MVDFYVMENHSPVFKFHFCLLFPNTNCCPWHGRTSLRHLFKIEQQSILLERKKEKKEEKEEEKIE
jgi:hypothetical protein